jgi:glyoxylase-like metal-dependent hydrolase (beta-lactamase superfamily II)
MAQESCVENLTPEDLPDGLKVVALPGHSFDMVGFQTTDNVIYLADCLSSKETLEKYQISFIYDVAAYLDTLEMVKRLNAKMFVPAHAQVTADIATLAQINIDKVHEIADKILVICKKPTIMENIMQQIFLEYNLEMNFEQNVLAGSTIRSYLAWLKDTGRMEVLFENGLLLWQSQMP